MKPEPVIFKAKRGLLQPRYRMKVEAGAPSTMTRSGTNTVTMMANVTVVKLPWWKWWRR